MYHKFLIHLSANGHPGCFHVLAIINSAAINTGVHVSPYPEPCSRLPPHPILLGSPSVPALSALFHASILDWTCISHMVIYMLQCSSLKSSHPCLPQIAKVCSLYLCLFCCLAYRVIVIIFLNSIYIVNIPYWCFSF